MDQFRDRPWDDVVAVQGHVSGFAGGGAELGARWARCRSPHNSVVVGFIWLQGIHACGDASFTPLTLMDLSAGGHSPTPFVVISIKCSPCPAVGCSEAQLFRVIDGTLFTFCLHGYFQH